MAIRAVSLTGLHVVTEPLPIGHVRPSSVPTEILNTVVRRPRVAVTGLHPRRARTHECLEDELMNRTREAFTVDI